MEIEDKGICRSCLKTFSGRGMQKHILFCKEKQRKDAEESKAGKIQKKYYYLKIRSFKPFWLYLEIDTNTTLKELDQFLRDIWLECCGHLSEFEINGIRYDSQKIESFWGGPPSKSMNFKLKNVLNVSNTFKYEYDFGSTTYLEGKVLAERTGYMKEKIRILARNDMPEIKCIKCGAKATQIYFEDDEFYCDKCIAELGYEDETLPVVNSPRMGVCAYTGEYDFDDFKKDAHI